MVYKRVTAVQIRSIRDLPKILDAFPDVKSVIPGRCNITKKRKYKISMRWDWASFASVGDWVVEDLINPGRIKIVPKDVFVGMFRVIK